MRIVAIDPAITGPTGLVIRLSNGAIHTRTTVQESGTHPIERMLRVAHILFNEHVDCSDLVLMEAPFVHMRALTPATYELAGILKAMAWLRTEEHPLMVNPQTLKKFATGSGASSVKKAHILKTVYTRWGFDTEDDNIADAFVISEIGLALCGNPSKALTQAQDECLDAVFRGNQDHWPSYLQAPKRPEKARRPKKSS